MISKDIWNGITNRIGNETQHPFALKATFESGGGCIHEAHILQGEDGRHYFVKTNTRKDSALFETEAEALREIRDSDSIRVPNVVCSGLAENRSYLVLEFIRLRPQRGHSLELLGQQLAAMHRKTGPHFGWTRDNFIGRTPQKNLPGASSWIEFWREYRLGPQVDMARKAGLSLIAADRLLDTIPRFFEFYDPAPSLLHGDLWGGNIGFDESGDPVIYDPATYYGDRETDIAFTELFGGPGPRFYSAYDEAWPRDPGYELRKPLYNFYHILNHYNLFGGGYGERTEMMLRELVLG